MRTEEEYRVRRRIVNTTQEMMRNFEQDGAVHWVEEWTMEAADAPADLGPMLFQLREYYVQRRGA